MTKRERVQAALARRPVDRPPVAFWRHVPEVDHTSAGLTEAMLAFQRRWDLDLIKIMSSGVYCVEDWGCRVAYLGSPNGAKTCTQHAIRQVSEALSSNGSTSMGSVCASTLSLLNAGVPLKAPVAGIAMGLVSDEVLNENGIAETRYVALTDILGAEDAFGDMDFKVAGTKDFVTALQLDTKLDGIPSQVLAGALAQAKDARTAILEVMAEAIDAPDEMSPYAPRVTAIKVPVDKIGEVIGPKGKMINSITEQTGASISIEDDGTVFVGATDGASAQAAIDMINAIANPQLPKIGERFLGTVVKTTDFGAFVSLLPGRDGLVHISKLGRGKRVAKVEDVVKVGDKLRVEIADIDNRGKISLIPVAEDNEAAAEQAAPAPVDAATASS